jgi:predicted ATPase
VIHLRAISWKVPPAEHDRTFPFSVPAIRRLARLEFPRPVTLLVGQNGSGKSTLLEALAVGAALPAVGAAESTADDTLAAQRRLASALRLSWNRRTRTGFFLRAEDFFGFQKRVRAQQQALQERIREVDATYQGRSDYARALAKGPAASELRDIERRYGADPDGRSHGEAFLDLLSGRLVPGGLYLLDEPEAALSPQSQLALLAMLMDMARRDAQFVIATHSPMLLACPDAAIYSFDQAPPARVAYQDLEHVTLTREFLNEPARFLRRLSE